MDILKTFGPLLGSIAPSIATALGGPLVGLGVKALSQALLGTEDGSEDAIMAAMATASPEQLAAVKKIDADFKIQMKSLDIDLAALAVDDRKSAREMQREVKDWIPRVLAVGVTLGFFGILIYILINGLPTTGNEAMLLLLGALQTAWMGIMAFYFGASSADVTKDKMLYNSTPKD